MISDDELFDLYLKENATILTSLRECYEQGRTDAIDECIEILEHDCFVSGTASKVLIHHLEQLKEQK